MNTTGGTTIQGSHLELQDEIVWHPYAFRIWLFESGSDN